MRRPKSMKCLCFCVLILAFIAQTSSTWAHAIDEAVWEAKLLENGEVKASLKLPNGLIDQFDKNGDGKLTADEIVDDIKPIIDKLIWVEGDGVRGELLLEPGDTNDVQLTHTIVGAIWKFPSNPKAHRFHYNYFVDSKENPKCIARFTTADDSNFAFVFNSEATEYELSPATRGFYGFLLIGVEHILLGFDHLLFVAVLMLAGGNASQLFKMITAFTIAHSLTLALAVLDIFTLPSSIVEPIIVLSIAVAAVENIRKDKPDDRWMLAAGFGLIHGMGFAGVLADMKLSGQDALIPLLGFNLGVEVGQLAVIFLALPAYYFISQQDWNRKFRIGSSVVAALIAIYWTLERVLG